MSELHSDSIYWIEVEKIRPNPYQPRVEFEPLKLESLSDSIRQYGVLQPLVVTRHETQKPDGGIVVEYELIAGERRLRASKMAGIAQVPVVIRTGSQDSKLKLELAIIENLQREDLNPVDRARAFYRFVDEFNFKHVEIAKRVGRSREYVSNTLRLLALPDVILNALSARQISEGHTRPILMLKDKPEEQMTLFKEIIHKKLTVRDAEAIARRVARDKIRKKSRDFDPEILKMEESLTESLGTRVQIEPREVGGKVLIEFFSDEDLKTLLALMNERSHGASVKADNKPTELYPETSKSSGEQSAPTISDVPDMVPVQEASAPEPIHNSAPQPEVAPVQNTYVPPVAQAPAAPVYTPPTPPVQEYSRPTPPAPVATPAPVQEIQSPSQENNIDSFTQIHRDMQGVRNDSLTSPAPSEQKKESFIPENLPVSDGNDHHNPWSATSFDKPVDTMTPPPTSQPQPATPPAPVAPPEDDAEDLYSVRNFSI